MPFYDTAHGGDRSVCTQAPVGPVHLIVDGSTTTAAGEWPTLSYNLITVAGAENTLPAPIYMIKLDTANAVTVGSGDVDYTLPEVPGFKLSVKAGSVTFPDGSKEGQLSVTAVNASKVPMAPPNGMQPQFIVTIQPTGAVFDPPAPISFPNTDGHAPGAEVEMYSYDHDLEEFVAIGLGTVSADGSVIESNPGVGVVKAGWHSMAMPDEDGDACSCGLCKKCSGSECQNMPEGSNHGQCVVCDGSGGHLTLSGLDLGCQVCAGINPVEKLEGVSITAAPAMTGNTAYAVGQSISFTAKASLAKSCDLEYEWDFGDGTPVKIVSSATIRHAFTSHGVFTARATVRCAGCAHSVQSTIVAAVDPVKITTSASDAESNEINSFLYEGAAKPITVAYLGQLGPGETVSWEIEALIGNTTDDLLADMPNPVGSSATVSDKEKGYGGIIPIYGLGPSPAQDVGIGTGEYKDPWFSPSTQETVLDFYPQPPSHYPGTYTSGSDKLKSNFGTKKIDVYRHNPRLAYRVTGYLEYFGLVVAQLPEIIVQMDDKDMIRQEYLNHGLAVPARNELTTPVPTEHFTRGEINYVITGNYDRGVTLSGQDYTRGTPLLIAESMRNWFNGVTTRTNTEPNSSLSTYGATSTNAVQVRIFDDAFVDGYSAVGQACTPNQPIISAGPAYDTFQRIKDATGTYQPVTTQGPAILTTIPVAPDIYNADRTAILCGPPGADGISRVHTSPDNRVGDQGLIVSSAWRNPERNERVNGVETSLHQFGGAVDLKTIAFDAGTITRPRVISAASQYCLLEHVGEKYLIQGDYFPNATTARGKAIAEIGQNARPCDNTRGNISHVHVQIR